MFINKHLIIQFKKNSNDKKEKIHMLMEEITMKTSSKLL